MPNRDPRVRSLVVELLTASPPAPTFQELEQSRAPRRQRPRRAMVISTIVLMALIGASVLVFRTHPDGQTIRPSGLAGRPAPDRFQVRPVLGFTGTPCREGAFLNGRFGPPQCVAVGPVALDGSSVASVSVA